MCVLVTNDHGVESPGLAPPALHHAEVGLPPESDTAPVAAGHASVALIHGLRAAEWAPVAERLERRFLARTGS